MTLLSRSIVAGAAVALLLGSAVVLQAARDAWYPRRDDVRAELYVQSGTALEKAALSFDALLADVYWIRAVQHYGGTRLQTSGTRSYHLLYPLLDVVTTLDPYFNIAYRFGAIFLSEGYPDGPGQPREAIALLEKGYRADPGRWQYLYDAAFVHYWWLRDYQGASEWFARAARVPGAPEWMPGLAAIMLTEGGDRQASRFLWQQILETADHEYMRANARHRLAQLRILDDLDQLDARLALYEQRTGHRASAWTALVQAGLLDGVPVDPAGEPYRIDPASGRAALADGSSYLPLPVGAGVDGPGVAVRP